MSVEAGGRWGIGRRGSSRAIGRIVSVDAWMALAAATFAVPALVFPIPSPAVAIRIGAVVAGTYVVTLVMFRRAARRGSRASLWILSVCAAALAADATSLAVARDDGGSRLTLGRRDWLLIAGGLILAVLLVARLVAELRRRIEMLDRMARTDPLTGIANRRALDEELPRELARARRDGSPVTVAIIDLDRFKAFNDMRGHQEGDAFLARTAESWHAALRESDFIARFGGEEFVVVFRHCGLENALPVVERLRIGVGESQTCSVGLARWNGSESAASLLTRADAALYAAKAAGRDRVKVAVTEDEATEGTPWPAIVRDVLEERSIISLYQPVVRLDSGGVVAFEALARPATGPRPGGVEGMFSSAQRMGLGRELDWLCRRAALSGAGWLPPTVPLFVNVGVSALVDPIHRVDQMLLVLRAAGRPPSGVVLEITERELVGDLNRLRQVVQSYRREGFRFAIDDVGEGHSTLEVLAAVQPEFVKIARSLVIEVGNRGPRAAVRAVVAFTEEIGAAVIAEGIETAQVAIAMRSLGVSLGQGYLFGRPGRPAQSRAAAMAAQPISGVA